MPWYIYLCCGISILIIVIFGLAFIKSRGANKNETHFAYNEYNNKYTWKDGTDYE